MINRNVNASVDANVDARCYSGNHPGAPRQGCGPLLHRNLKSVKQNTGPKNSDMFTLKIQPASRGRESDGGGLGGMKAIPLLWHLVSW